MLTLTDAMNVAASGMIAQSVRLNTIASNMANAESVAGSADGIYKAKVPVFESIYLHEGSKAQGVIASKIINSDAPALAIYSPNHPKADENGFIYKSNVNKIEQIADMTSAQQSFESNVEVQKAAKQLLMQSIKALK
ncbi:flagellar basal body rod protein FlgC [Photobacterium toruni]|uniref:flagellar basal body rod protein FlgC n=1 Tax=Photobacterium toruni TaxID=1935446 RepID=UPI00210F304B|nr:flagellar basal body rod protein FlgC [Photobacterium toruni]